MGLKEDEGYSQVGVVVDGELSVKEILGEDEIEDKEGLSFGDLTLQVACVKDDAHE